jgi:hypothetical protein
METTEFIHQGHVIQVEHSVDDARLLMDHDLYATNDL